VIIPLVTQHHALLQRNVLYTALTRARRLVVLIGSRRAVAMAVGRDQPSRRLTWLAERLREQGR
jgi:exodeoxyribonuclease V alpha subunit